MASSIASRSTSNGRRRTARAAPRKQENRGIDRVLTTGRSSAVRASVRRRASNAVAAAVLTTGHGTAPDSSRHGDKACSSPSLKRPTAMANAERRFRRSSPYAGGRGGDGCDRVTIVARAFAEAAFRPDSGAPSRRLHSRYERRLFHLTCHGRPVALKSPGTALPLPRLFSPDRRRLTQRVGRGDWPAETLRAMAAASGDLSVERGGPCRRAVRSGIAARIPAQAARAPAQAARTCLGATRVGTTDFAASSA